MASYMTNKRSNNKTPNNMTPNNKSPNNITPNNRTPVRIRKQPSPIKITTTYSSNQISA